MDLVGWNGLVAPAGTPAPVIDRLAKACESAVSSPALQTFGNDQGYLVSYAPPAEFQTYIVPP